MATEVKIVVQALRLNTLSRLTFADSKRFDALIKDVFADVQFQDVDYPELNAALQQSAEEMGLIVSKIQVCHYFIFSNQEYHISSLACPNVCCKLSAL